MNDIRGELPRPEQEIKRDKVPDPTRRVQTRGEKASEKVSGGYRKFERGRVAKGVGYALRLGVIAGVGLVALKAVDIIFDKNIEAEINREKAAIIDYTYADLPESEFAPEFIRTVQTRGLNYYNVYMDNPTAEGFSILNAPKKGDASNSNITLITCLKEGCNFFFLTRRDGASVDAIRQAQAQIAVDLGLSDEQKQEMISIWEDLAGSEGAMVEWLIELRDAGVVNVTQGMIDFYSDPGSFYVRPDTNRQNNQALAMLREGGKKGSGAMPWKPPALRKG